MRKLARFVSRYIPFALIAFVLITGGGACLPAKATAPVKVFVSIPPQAYLVEQIGGEHVQVSVLVRPGQDPHTFEPRPRQIVELSAADAYFAVGLPFEARLLDKITGSHADLIVEDITRGIKRRKLTSHLEHGESGDEEHGDGHNGGHGEPDPHVWMSPVLTRQLAENIYQALSKLNPQHAADYRQNLAEFSARLEDVHNRIAARLRPYAGREFFVFHPAFGYFGATYGLEQVAVEIEGKKPRPRQLAELIGRARQQGIKVIFVQPQFDRKSAETIAQAIGGTIIPLDPLAADLLQNYEQIATHLEESLRRAGETSR